MQEEDTARSASLDAGARVVEPSPAEVIAPMENMFTPTEHEECHEQRDQQAASTGTMGGEKGPNKESLPQASDSTSWQKYAMYF